MDFIPAAYWLTPLAAVLSSLAGTIRSLCCMVFGGLGIIQTGALLPDINSGQVAATRIWRLLRRKVCGVVSLQLSPAGIVDAVCQRVGSRVHAVDAACSLQCAKPHD